MSLLHPPRNTRGPTGMCWQQQELIQVAQGGEGGAALCQSLVIFSSSLLLLGRTAHTEEALLFTCAWLPLQRAGYQAGNRLASPNSSFVYLYSVYLKCDHWRGLNGSLNYTNQND